MYKQVKNLISFKGVLSTASPRDLPEDALVYAENVDTSIGGLVRGIQDSFTLNSTMDARLMTALTIDGDRVIIGMDSSRAFWEFDLVTGAATQVSSLHSYYGMMMIPHNNAVYVSMSETFRDDDPKPARWFGKLKHVQFFDSSETHTPSLSSSISSGATSFNLSSTALMEVNDFIITHDDDDAEIMKITAINDPEITVERGVGYTEAVAHDSSVNVSIVEFYDTFEYASTLAEARSFYEDGGHITLESVSFTGGGATIFDTETTYYYGFSYVYDGYQESPLVTKDASGDYWSYNPSGNSFLATITLNVNYAVNTDFSPRITGINVYRAESPESTTDEGPLSPYNFVRTLDLTSSGTPVTEWQKQVESGVSYTTIFKDRGFAGASYEDNSGLPDSLERAYVDYKIATKYSNYLFVADCKTPDIPDAEKYVFRSKFGTPSVIDWTADFCILPERPTALAGFGGRLYAFSEGNMYRINPVTMSIEDTYSGVGALNENMVITTNYGMFHADQYGVYHNGGNGPSTILSDPISTIEWGTENGYWSGIKTANGQYASIAFDPRRERILVFANDGPSSNRCYAYDVLEEKWMFYFDIDMPITHVNIDNLIFASVGSGAEFDLVRLHNSTTGKNWKIVTKDFDFDSPTGEFWVYDISVRGTGDFIIKYYKDGNDSEIAPTVTDPASDIRRISLDGLKVKSIGVVVESDDDSDEIDGITIQYRLPVIDE